MSSHKKPKTINPDEVDPSVYYYDEVYDDMKEEEKRASHKDNESRNKKNGDKSSKYIQGLLEIADIRKAEKEMRKFKKYAQDREEAEAEGLLDKTDVYITAAYEKKLKEINKISEGIGKRLKQEEGRVLNFHKSNSKNLDESKTHNNIDTDVTKSSTTSETKISRKEDGDTEQGSCRQQVESLTDKPTPRRQMKTSEERLEYLRQVLAKRTVGEVFKDAQEKYKQRKAMIQK